MLYGSDSSSLLPVELVLVLPNLRVDGVDLEEVSIMSAAEALSGVGQPQHQPNKLI